MAEPLLDTSPALGDDVQEPIDEFTVRIQTARRWLAKSKQKSAGRKPSQPSAPAYVHPYTPAPDGETSWDRARRHHAERQRIYRRLDGRKVRGYEFLSDLTEQEKIERNRTMARERKRQERVRKASGMPFEQDVHRLPIGMTEEMLAAANRILDDLDAELAKG